MRDADRQSSGKAPTDTPVSVTGESGDTPPGGHPSLEGMHGTVAVPHHEAGFWKQWRVYVGPALLISIGYMDPGNWGTDLSGGASFKYDLLWVSPSPV